MMTIPISDVPRATSPMTALDRGASVRSLLRKRLEAQSPSTARLVQCTDAHPFVLAAHEAFYKHYPLVLSPDTIWFCLAQGFAQHVGQNVERLRHRFVRHEGKVKLTVERPDFHLGQENPWPEVFAAFSHQIAAHVGRLRDLVVADFSTTGPTERAASEVVLMDTFQGYFEYEMLCGCGIPSVTLLGTPEDWRSIRRRAAMLSEFELDGWTRALLPVLDAIVQSAEGRADPAFWRSFFRYQSGSGPSELTGWILTLFPYLREPRTGALVPNPHLETWEVSLRESEQRGPRLPRYGDLASSSGKPWATLAHIPSGLASAPVSYFDIPTGETHPLRFVAGLFGVAQDPVTLALQPEFGWAVVYEE